MIFLSDLETEGPLEQNRETKYCQIMDHFGCIATKDVFIKTYYKKFKKLREGVFNTSN